MIGKRALNSGINPLVFALYREIGGTICLMCLAYYMNGPWRMARKDAPDFLLLVTSLSVEYFISLDV